MVSNICNYLHKKSKKELITGIFLSVAVNFLFFFYAPLEILFLNKKDLFFSTGQIIRVIFPLFLMGTLMGILVMAILWLISEKAVFAGVFEMIARSVVSLGFVGVFGFTAICFADQTAWVSGCLYLIPTCILCLKKTAKKLKVSNA